MSSTPGGGSDVECSIPTDPATLADLGADMSGADTQQLADADLSFNVSFGTLPNGSLDHVTSSATGSLPEGTFTFDTAIELRDWNQPVSIQTPTSTGV